MVITAKRALFVWLLAITGAASIPITCAVSRAHPAPPEPCLDAVEVRTWQQDAFKCSPGAKLTTEALPHTEQFGDRVFLAKCACPPQEKADAHDQDR